MKLASLLQIQPGVTAVIGGGGKTTLLRTLGEELSKAHSVLLCTTTKIMPFPGIPWTDSLERLDELRKEHRLLCMGTLLPESGKLDRPNASMAELMERFDYVLVEADGAARRPYWPVLMKTGMQRWKPRRRYCVRKHCTIKFM